MTVRTLKKALAAAGLMALAASANAAFINVGGVVWDPDDPIDFTSRSDNITQNIDLGPPTTLSGWGIITSVNGTNQSTFCPGCELTFAFSGYTQTATNLGGAVAEFNDGTVDLYVGAGADKDFVDGGSLAAATNGTLWLSLAGHEVSSILGGPNRTLFVSATPSGATGTGFLDVINGLAAANFNTNSISDTEGGFADFDIQNSFTGTSNFTLGSGNFSGDSVAVTVPEPASIALLGVGLLGLGAVRRRKI